MTILANEGSIFFQISSKNHLTKINEGVKSFGTGSGRRNVLPEPKTYLKECLHEKHKASLARALACAFGGNLRCRVLRKLGDEEEAETYSVYDVEGLLEWAAAAEANPKVNCTLYADIDMSGYTWTPIGSSYSDGYAGKFDGNGHVISNLTISSSDESYGFFWIRQWRQGREFRVRRR